MQYLSQEHSYEGIKDLIRKIKAKIIYQVNKCSLFIQCPPTVAQEVSSHNALPSIHPHNTCSIWPYPTALVHPNLTVSHFKGSSPCLSKQARLEEKTPPLRCLWGVKPWENGGNMCQ